MDLNDLYRRESRHVLATLIRLLGDFELAEDALQEAFAAALRQWPDQGVPDNPRAWLISTGRFKAIDRIRRHDRHRSLLFERDGACEPEPPRQSPWTESFSRAESSTTTISSMPPVPTSFAVWAGSMTLASPTNVR